MHIVIYTSSGIQVRVLPRSDRVRNADGDSENPKQRFSHQLIQYALSQSKILGFGGMYMYVFMYVCMFVCITSTEFFLLFHIEFSAFCMYI